MREIYLDNSATTRPYDAVRAIMNEVMDLDYGNPSSLHQKGVQAEQYIKRAKTSISRCLKVQEKELIFTSGGTEADNLAIIGAAFANARSGKHLITGVNEHPAVLRSMAFLEEQGFRVTYLPVDFAGRVRLEDVEQALCEDTILVSLMFVNNEVGAVQPIEAVAELLHRKHSGALFHVDAVQAFGKVPIYPKRMGIDMLSISGHKIHGPKGIGVLYVREGVKIKPTIFGGGQQKNLRSGTENVPAIAGMGKAAEMICGTLSEDVTRLYEDKLYFIQELQKVPGVTVNGLPEASYLEEAVKQTAPHIVSVSVDDVRAEVMLHALEDRGIYVSSGSACASNKPAISETLKGMGLPKEHLESTLRFSFSVFTTREDLDEAVRALQELLPLYRRFVRK